MYVCVVRNEYIRYDAFVTYIYLSISLVYFIIFAILYLVFYFFYNIIYYIFEQGLRQ